jgi:outer membrane protein OmpA-like peptidoglycan-associated protein
MRTWIIGTMVLVAWISGSSYWYVCKIKGLCFEGNALIADAGEIKASENKDTLVADPVDTADDLASMDERNVQNSEQDSLIDENTKGPSTVTPTQLQKPFTVLFAFAGPQAEGRAALEAYLDDLVRYLKHQPDRKVLLRGYTDDTAARENNLKLAQRRCDVIADMLLAKGLPPGKITTKALGEADPVATNDTPEGRRLNRRVVISIQELP